VSRLMIQLPIVEKSSTNKSTSKVK